MQTHISTFFRCYFQNIMLIMANLVFKISLTYNVLSKLKKKTAKKPLVVFMPDVVIGTSKIGKNPINFERKVKASEQQLIKIVPSLSSMTVDVSPTTAAPCFDDTPRTCPAPRYRNNSPEKYIPTVKEIKQKVRSGLKGKTLLDLKQAKRDTKKKN